MWSNRTGVTDLRDDYTTNALNQYTSRENNTVPVSGTAEPDTGGAGGVAVAIEGRTAPAGRQGRYWNDEVTVNNNSPSAHPWRGPLTIFTAKRGTGGAADVFRMDVRMAEIAAVLQDFTYDHDGNLTGDAVLDYQWDAENRLVRIETSSTAQSYNFPHRVMEFRYDYLGRRVQKRVWDAAPNPDVEISCRRYLYDGWNLIAEYNAAGGSSMGTLLRSYTWGLDIVNSMTSAGGVGALLQIADHPGGKTYLPAYDGNGNIVALLNADTDAVAAAYEFSSYGEPLRAQTFDPIIADNPFRFSTKFTDLETGLVYYGRRYYCPSQGRFLGRDPIEEAGGLNLYGFCANNPINRYDVLGNLPAWLEGLISYFVPDSGRRGGNDLGTSNAIPSGVTLGIGMGGGDAGSSQGSLTFTSQSGPNSGGGLTVGEFLTAVVTGAGEGFQKNVIDPLGTAAGLVVYTSVPGTITVGGGVGLGGFVSISRDNDGRIAVIGGAGFAAGVQFEVSTNTPTLTTNSSSFLLGVSTQASVNVGGVSIGAGGQVFYAGAAINDFTVSSRLNTNFAVGGVLGGGREGGVDIFGNGSSRDVDGRLGGGNYATVGLGGLLFWGANVGGASGPDPIP